ncbi:hypothetical protein UM93_05925 [Psychromicrobium lacuslunae]|uniref:Uncharacterized protein n=1 Tax=Psychromicrobium lacuslunae TaxID=1618207 RepID=A0A0D4BXX3_9MICC|nr:hypothetical protein UM93_05925 [Psychromicrobium lacuslunae]
MGFIKFFSKPIVLCTIAGLCLLTAAAQFFFKEPNFRLITSEVITAMLLLLAAASLKLQQPQVESGVQPARRKLR